MRKIIYTFILSLFYTSVYCDSLVVYNNSKNKIDSIKYGSFHISTDSKGRAEYLFYDSFMKYKIYEKELAFKIGNSKFNLKKAGSNFNLVHNDSITYIINDLKYLDTISTFIHWDSYLSFDRRCYRFSNESKSIKFYYSIVSGKIESIEIEFNSSTRLKIDFMYQSNKYDEIEFEIRIDRYNNLQFNYFTFYTVRREPKQNDNYFYFKEFINDTTFNWKLVRFRKNRKRIESIERFKTIFYYNKYPKAFSLGYLPYNRFGRIKRKYRKSPNNSYIM